MDGCRDKRWIAHSQFKVCLSSDGTTMHEQFYSPVFFCFLCSIDIIALFQKDKPVVISFFCYYYKIY